MFRFDLSAAHQMNARQQHPIYIQQRLHPSGPLFLEQLPLRLRKTEIVMRMVFGDTSA